MLFRLLPLLAKELFLPSNFLRRPEPEMVMRDHIGVAAYDTEGKEGVLLGVYYYHLIQMCGIIKPGDTVIDLGCGPCNLLCILAELNPECQFIGIDLSSEMLAIAHKNITQKKIKNIQLLNQDITYIKEITAGSIDVAISSMTIHHLPNETVLEHLFAEIKRILKPKQRFYLYDFGKVKRTETIDFFLTPVNNGFVKEDYYNSLRAAFTRPLFSTLTQKYLGQSAQFYSTRFAPLIVVIKSESSPLAEAHKTCFRVMLDSLNKQQKDDFQTLKLFLLLSGLRSLL